MKHVLVFFAMFALDYVWAKYSACVARGSAVGAANWSVPICVLAGFVTVSYVSDPWLLIPAALGGWAGTYVAMIHNRVRT